MSQLWTIFDKTSGAVLCPSFTTPSAGSHPKDNGWPWDGATQQATQIDAQPDPGLMNFSPATKTWSEDPAAVQTVLVAAVKAANEALVRGIYSTNFGKQKKYASKQQEVLDYRALGGAAADPNSFRFAVAQAAKRGVSLDVIIGEFEAAIDATEQQVANWEATELEAIRAIKAAPTAAAKRAAYAAINWGWSAS